MARLLRQPPELVEFHLWYLKSKGWVERLDTGQLATSALGVDEVEQGRFKLRNDNMLTAGGVAREGAEEQPTRFDPANPPVFPGDTDFNQYYAMRFSHLTQTIAGEGECFLHGPITFYHGGTLPIR